MKLVVDLRKKSIFEYSQAYVMLSRVQEISQLYIIADEIPRQWLRPSHKALAELKRLDEVSINNNLPAWYNPNDNSTRITFYNTRSHKKHYIDTKNSRLINMSDLILLNETWLTDSANKSDYMIEGYHEPRFVIAGHGKGLVTYQKTNYNPKFKRIFTYNDETYQMILLENSQMYVLSVYRSEKAERFTVMMKIREILGILDRNKLFIIGGDFNTCATEKNVITNTLTNEYFGFTQMILEATHEKGRALDHLYIRNMTKPISVAIEPLYWTDHDAITVMVPRQEDVDS